LRFAPFAFRVERALAAPFPQRQHIVGIIATRTSRQIEQRAMWRCRCVSPARLSSR
jgi:hypothetical protein